MPTTFGSATRCARAPAQWLLALAVLLASSPAPAGPAPLITAKTFAGKPQPLGPLKALHLTDETAVVLRRHDGGTVVVGFDRIDAVSAQGQSIGFDWPAEQPGVWPGPAAAGASAGTEHQWWAAALQSDDSLVLAGEVWHRDAPDKFETRRVVIARVDARGRLDPRFGTNGIVSLPGNGQLPRRAMRPEAVAVQPDGKLLVAGRAEPLTNSEDSKREPLFILRLAADGTIDRSFGRDGVVRPGDGEIIAEGFGRMQMEVTTEGKILLLTIVVRVPQDGSSPKADIWLHRLDDLGRADNSFGDHGVLPGHGGDVGFLPGRLVPAASGSYLVAGSLDRHGDGRMCGLLKVDSTGRPVREFGVDGYRSWRPQPAEHCTVTDVVEAADGSLLVAGYLSYVESGPHHGIYSFFVDKLGAKAPSAVANEMPRAPLFEIDSGPGEGFAWGSGLVVLDGRIGALFRCAGPMPPEGRECRRAGLIELR